QLIGLGLLRDLYCVITRPRIHHQAGGAARQCWRQGTFQCSFYPCFYERRRTFAANTVKASLVERNKSVDLPLKENNILQTLDGTRNRSSERHGCDCRPLVGAD